MSVSLKPESIDHWVDINVHLERMPDAVESTLARASAAGVRCIATGTDPAQWEQMLQWTGVGLAFGLHPLVEPDGSDWQDRLHAALLSRPQAAVGEIGLDRRHKAPVFEAQMLRCRWQLKLAKTLDRPVILHVVRAHQEMLELIRSESIDRFVVHAFNGSQEIGAQYLALGGYLSAGGMLSWNPPPRALPVFATMPMERMLLETDAPDLPIEGADVGDPIHLPSIGRLVARARGISPQAVAYQTTENARVLFGDDFAQSDSRPLGPP